METALQTAESLRIQGWTEERLKARKVYSSIVDTPDGKIPYQPWAEARRQQILRRYGGDDITEQILTVRDVSPELLCIIGTPRAVFFADFQVLQAPGVVVLAWERSGEYRIIPLNSRGPRLPQAIKLHMGDARGRWEGNTLVVETTNLNDWSWFDSKGTIHSDAMSLVERFEFVESEDDELSRDGDGSESVDPPIHDGLHAEAAERAGRRMGDSSRPRVSKASARWKPSSRSAEHRASGSGLRAQALKAGDAGLRAPDSGLRAPGQPEAHSRSGARSPEPGAYWVPPDDRPL